MVVLKFHFQSTSIVTLKLIVLKKNFTEGYFAIIFIPIRYIFRNGSYWEVLLKKEEYIVDIANVLGKCLDKINKVEEMEDVNFEQNSELHFSRQLLLQQFQPTGCRYFPRNRNCYRELGTKLALPEVNSPSF